MAKPVNYSKLLSANKPLRRLFAATFVSSVGDWCRHVALVGLVLSCTGAGLKMAVILLLEVIPLLLVGPLAGVLIDKRPPPKVMIACDLARALFSLCFLLIHSQEQLWLAYALTALISLFDAPALAARQTLISKLAASETLVTAHALFSIGAGLCIAAGAAAATAIADIWGNPRVFVFDAAAYLLSYGLLFTLRERGPRRPAAAAPPAPLNYIREVRQGLRYIQAHQHARQLLIFNALRSAGSGAIYFLLGVFGYTVFKGGFQGVGVLHVTFGVGFLTGALAANKLALRFGWRRYARIMGIAATAEGIFVCLFSRMHHVTAALALLALAYTARSIVITLFNSLSSRLIAEGYRGRYFALNRVLSYTAMGASMLLCGLALELATAPQLALWAGLFLLANGWLWTSRRPRIRAGLAKTPEFIK